MIINFNDITKYYGSELVLDKVSGTVAKNSRIGIIGANGAGKTTLVKIISGFERADSGQLYINPDVVFCHLEQTPVFKDGYTVEQEMKTVFQRELDALEKLKNIKPDCDASKSEYDSLMKFINARDAYNIDVKINYVLNGMGFSQRQKQQMTSTLSGGEKTRLAIAKLLLSDANVMILDEPTNHLDFKTCTWLENYLQSYPGAVICVTHDRYFLDRVCSEIWEIEFGHLTKYQGGYSNYKETKDKNLKQAQKIYRQQLEYQNKLQDYIAKNLVRASTSKMAKSRQKELDRMEEAKKPQIYSKQIHIKFLFNKKSWFDVLKCSDVSVFASGKRLFSGFTIDLKAGEKLAVIGDNGAGKTTLFKTLSGVHKEYTGRINWGKEVSIGIYEQNHTYPHPDKTVKDEFWDQYPQLTDNEVRSVLAAFLFSADDIEKKVANLSGGESARLQLAILSKKNCNTLLLDEPTNHLDIMSKEYLEAALSEFCGTELIISHDRYLLNTIPDKIVYISESFVKVFDGKYDDVIQHIQQLETEDKPVKKEQSNTNQTYKSKQDRAAAAQKRSRLYNCEKQIAQLENQIKELEEIISKNPDNYQLLSEACDKLEENKHQLDSLTELWLSLSE